LNDFNIRRKTQLLAEHIIQKFGFDGRLRVNRILHLGRHLLTELKSLFVLLERKLWDDDVTNVQHSTCVNLNIVNMSIFGLENPRSKMLFLNPSTVAGWLDNALSILAESTRK